MASSLNRSGSAPQFHLDESWKLTKKDGTFYGGGGSRITRSSSTTSCHGLVNARVNGGGGGGGGNDYRKRNQKQERCNFTRKCAKLVKEQRARFYIMRRCVIMLICWRDNYSDS